MREKCETDLYPIKHEPGYFHAGATGDGRQVLMGLYCPNLVAIYFDRSGELQGTERRPLEFLWPRGESNDIYDERIGPRLRAWQDEMGFRPETIRVKRFFITELGIEIYPEHFGEILADPEASDEDKDDIRDSMRAWDADEQFVLFWGNDFWLDGTGEVVSS